MSHFEYADSDYWEKVHSLDNHSRSVTEGDDGESEFDRKMVKAADGRSVLDVGCGDGLFTATMSDKAKSVAGVDFSKVAISEARRKTEGKNVTNLRFELARAERLPFPAETFDLVTCRRGPVSDRPESLSEAYRVLKMGGTLMEITIGEHDKENIARIFGRGQMLGSEKVSIVKERMLREAGFNPIEIRDYKAVEIFPSMKDVIVRLKNSPIIPGFDLTTDAIHLEKVEGSCKTTRGIETQTHRVAIIARKWKSRTT